VSPSTPPLSSSLVGLVTRLSAFIVLYLLAVFVVLSVPLLQPDIVAQQLPVVRASDWLFKHGLLTSGFILLDPLMAARVFRRLLPRISRLGHVHVPRVFRRVSRVAQGECPAPTLSQAFTLKRELGLTPLRVTSSSRLYTSAGNWRRKERSQRERCHRGLARFYKSPSGLVDAARAHV
jgi:hypothetical protein